MEETGVAGAGGAVSGFVSGIVKSLWGRHRNTVKYTERGETAKNAHPSCGFPRRYFIAKWRRKGAGEKGMGNRTFEATFGGFSLRRSNRLLVEQVTIPNPLARIKKTRAQALVDGGGRSWKWKETAGWEALPMFFRKTPQASTPPVHDTKKHIVSSTKRKANFLCAQLAGNKIKGRLPGRIFLRRKKNVDV